MPTSTRRQAASRLRIDEEFPGAAMDVDEVGSDDVTTRDPEDLPGSGESHMLEDPEDVQQYEDDHLFEDEVFPPPGLKEISSLASWTVSTAKPGNGIAALRSPDTNLFWQSDGPQPHLLSIHFFKLVAIVHMRIFLDCVSDESYTPTKMQFLAGMGLHDIQEFAEMSFESPRGWIDVDFSNVGPIDDDEEDQDADDDHPRQIDWTKRPVLRAFLIQIKILENHQNGKDTHLRGVQLFAVDPSQQQRRGESDANETVGKVQEVIRSPAKPAPAAKKRHREVNNIKLASWMMDPVLR